MCKLRKRGREREREKERERMGGGRGESRGIIIFPYSPFRVANDDQYASNVPDSFVPMGASEAHLYHEGGRTQGEELGSKSQSLFYNSLTSRNARVKTESREAGISISIIPLHEWGLVIFCYTIEIAYLK